MSRFALTALAAAASAVLLMGVSPGPQPPQDNKQLAHDIFKQLVEIHSSDTIGTKEIADAIAARLLGGGFAKSDIHILPEEKYPNQVSVVVRYQGKGKGKPILWNCHIDIVDARPEDWTLPPFKFTEKDGYFYGRGTSDMKDQDAAVLATLLRLRHEGFVPDRDIIVAFTADEEGDWAQDGMRYLMDHHRDLVDAGLAINPDGDSGEIISNGRADFGVETSQKIYVTYTLTETNKGGHSSEPRPDNAIYQLANALVRFSKYQFPLKTNATTRLYFERMATQQSGQRKADYLTLAKEPLDLAAAQRLTADIPLNAILHSTCVATMLNAGVQENALPARAVATVQCRIMPDETAAGTKATIEQVIADPSIKVGVLGQVITAPESPPSPAVFKKLETVVHSMWPGVAIVPSMSAGASDSLFTRNGGIPSYGVSGSWIDIHDIRAHGRDERREEHAFYESVEFTHRLMQELTKAE
jgi:acetylornithine deacetylase/succinyl-diaminopimelate desuccinylase-like protein